MKKIKEKMSEELNEGSIVDSQIKKLRNEKH